MVQRVTMALSTAAVLAIPGNPPETIATQNPVLELDHVYVVVPPGATEAVRVLRQAGLVIDSSVTRHIGQGTASIGVFFENAYLELLWVDSSVAVDSLHRMDLEAFRRAAAWRQSGASPFGIGLHLLSGEPSALGVPLRLDSARMRPGSHLVLLRQPEESLAVDMFIPPNYLAVTSWLGRYRTRRPDLFRHPLGVRRITRVLVRGPRSHRPRAAILQSRLVDFVEASSPQLVVEFDGRPQGLVVDLRPVLPLILQH